MKDESNNQLHCEILGSSNFTVNDFSGARTLCIFRRRGSRRAGRDPAKAGGNGVGFGQKASPLSRFHLEGGDHLAHAVGFHRQQDRFADVLGGRNRA